MTKMFSWRKKMVLLAATYLLVSFVIYLPTMQCEIIPVSVLLYFAWWNRISDNPFNSIYRCSLQSRLHSLTNKHTSTTTTKYVIKSGQISNVLTLNISHIWINLIKWKLKQSFILLISLLQTRNEDRIERSERQTCTKMDSIEAAEEQ